MQVLYEVTSYPSYKKAHSPHNDLGQKVRTGGLFITAAVLPSFRWRQFVKLDPNYLDSGNSVEVLLC